MKVLVLAGGYGTRLGALTLNTPKQLLLVAGRPIFTHILSAIELLPAVGSIYVITNCKFFRHFLRWRAETPSRCPIIVVNDGTHTNEERLGAIGDIHFMLDMYGIDDDLLVVGGDNLFAFRLRDFVEFAQQRGTSLAVYTLPRPEDAAKYGNVKLDDQQRVVWFEEKPKRPQTRLIATAVYYFKREHLPLFRRYCAEGNNQDAPGFFIKWLYQQVDVYGYAFDGYWFDIGSPESLAEAEARLAGG
ncbi:MAG: nucleotidyltransferase family protein [Abditibacteriales bacterium]|nr:nucleotidyltransferase family protein [Abditibacteriales bacterium]MDW8364470.1 nucleotidyltransferase family protein [Abditibacteriales bacterium]